MGVDRRKVAFSLLGGAAAVGVAVVAFVWPGGPGPATGSSEERRGSAIIERDHLTPRQFWLLYEGQALWPSDQDIEKHRPGPGADLATPLAELSAWLAKILHPQFVPESLEGQVVFLADYGPFEHKDESGHYWEPESDFMLLRYRVRGHSIELIDDGGRMNVTLLLDDPDDRPAQRAEQLVSTCRSVFKLPTGKAVTLRAGEVAGWLCGVFEVGDDPVPKPGEWDPQTRRMKTPKWWQDIHCRTNGQWVMFNVFSSNKYRILREMGHTRAQGMPVKRFMPEAQLRRWTHEWLDEEASQHNR